MDGTTNFKKILFSPLDWGMGHTTRSIPLLKKLQSDGHEIFIACEPQSASEKILHETFPDAQFLPLKGYGIRYARNPKFFAIKMFFQIPKILRAVYNENKSVKKWCGQYDFDEIISDNRYGFFNKKIKSVFITHQLQIIIPFAFLEKIIRELNYTFIGRFNECFVPDFEEKNNLSGKLAHPTILPKIPVKYIGPQSRLQKISAEKKYDLLILLSGPEPQRTVLENHFLQIKNLFKEKVLLIRGLPKASQSIASTENFTIKNYCDANELSEAIAQSEFVIARSGYSTVMDLFCLQKKAIFIPTPGQTEQEYLAETLMKKGFAFSFKQEEKDYYKKIEEGKRFDYR